MKLHPVKSWKPSPRVEIRPGDVVKLIGAGGSIGSRLPGKFRVVAILRKVSRVWLEVVGLDRTAGAFTVFVAGRPYRRHGQRWTPYRVQRRRVLPTK